MVTKLDKYKKLEELRQEEKVMKYLAAPYISEVSSTILHFLIKFLIYKIYICDS